MNEIATRLIMLKKQLAKIEKDFKNDKTAHNGFTVQIHYGGNKSADLTNVVIASMYNKEDSALFLEIVKRSIHGSIKLYTTLAESERKELDNALNDTKI